MNKYIVVLLCIAATSKLWAEEPEWTSLFDGHCLHGWTQMGGDASFEVVDGQIVGTTAPDTPNSFLCTDKVFGNFILEFEFLVDGGLNSGVQFRSQFIDGLVRGYQFEIDPDKNKNYTAFPLNLDETGSVIPPGTAPRSWTGGIYEEKRRGWIGDLTGNAPARDAFRPGEWNKARVEAINDGIKTYINGVLAANIVDYVTPNGFIALQVHAVPEYKELQVRFRNLRIQDMGLNPEPGDEPDPFVSEWSDDNQSYLAQVFFDKDNKQYKLRFTDKPYANADPLVVLDGAVNGQHISFSDPGGVWTGMIENKRLIITGPDVAFTGRKTRRVPADLNAPPPEGAIVLFDGSNMDAWGSLAPKEWLQHNGEGVNSVKMVPGSRFEMVPGKGSIITKETYGDCFLHLEFRLLGETTNGGVYMMSRYEFNIKDSYGQGKGSVVGQWGNVASPDYSDAAMNYALPPLEWQTMDIEFKAPRFDQQGNKIANARATMYLNGELMYQDAEVEALKGASGRLGEAATGPVYLQEHGTAYQFRNIWIIDQTKTSKK